MKKIFNNTAIFSFSILLLCLLFSSSVNAQTDTKKERVYIKIEIKGMACPYCAFGMEKELKKVAGVDNVEIELKEGLAYISTPISQKPTKESLEKIIIDGGFTVGTIEFSSSAFKRTKTKKKE
ncbi:heavy-metal-associated domain-containing protein [Ancylomarina longa]|uniref:Heavy-metal-associated domain-containing protein n=1 Tax=Ancylomarina longa TaxID=2487017 RepID=A0A434AG18_9BACT|nr:heavy metal-associated domain-containing protein [Ancylomarina longa]RUT73309.1 heavy-metal-associated domain-containing protein [Ancylomarina longa]